MQPRTLEINTWLNEKKCRAVVANLTKKHFTAVYCATAQEASDYILAQAQSAHSVGFGGSLLWFGSSAGVALATLYPQARSAGAWLRDGWHVAVAYLLGFGALLALLGWHP